MSEQIIPRWEVAPPDRSRLQHLPLLRLGPQAALRAAITSPDVLGVLTHFMGGRTLACIQGDCPGCESKLPQRWEGYLGVVTTKPSRHIILGITPGAALGIGDSAPDPHNLRGLLLVAERIGKRANARLRARVEEVELGQLRLPDPPDLKAHLLHIWGLDQAHAGNDHPDYRAEVLRTYGRSPGATDGNSIE